MHYSRGGESKAKNLKQCSLATILAILLPWVYGKVIITTLKAEGVNAVWTFAGSGKKKNENVPTHKTA